VRQFVFVFSLAFLGLTLAATGLGHLLRFRQFSALIHMQRMIPGRASAASAALVTGIELALATVLALGVAGLLAFDGLKYWLVVCGGLGGMFLYYVHRLMRAPVRAVSCGCSPIESPVSPASYYPAAALILCSCVSMTAGLSLERWPAATATSLGPFALWMPTALAAVLAGLILLFPASVPGAERSAAR